MAIKLNTDEHGFYIWSAEPDWKVLNHLYNDSKESPNVVTMQDTSRKPNTSYRTSRGVRMIPAYELY